METSRPLSPSLCCEIISSDSAICYLKKPKARVRESHDETCHPSNNVKITVKDGLFSGNRILLKCQSKYFREALSINEEAKTAEIKIPELASTVFQLVLNFVNSGEIILSEDNIEDVLDAASYLEIEPLKNLCTDYLLRVTNLENYQRLLKMADRYNLGSAYPRICQLIGQYLANLSDDDMFCECLTLKMFLRFLQEDVYMDITEGGLLALIFKWVEYDKESREMYLLTLLNHIRFPMLEYRELRGLSQEVISLPGIREKVVSAKRHQASVSEQCLNTGEEYLPRGSETWISLVCTDPERNGRVFLHCDPNPNTQKWCLEESSIQGPNCALEFTRQVVLGNFLYVAGGYNELCCSDDRLFRYDPRARDWSEFAPMNEPRAAFAMCSGNSAMYVMGGINHLVEADTEHEIILKTSETYNPSQNTWSALPDLPTGCFDQAAAFWDDCVYVSGGISDNDEDTVPLDRVYCHKLGSNHWSTLPSMLFGRQSHVMAAASGKLFVLGGRMASARYIYTACLITEMYDIEAELWTMLTHTPPHYGYISRFYAQEGSRLYLLAGHDGEQSLHVYDTATDEMTDGNFVGSDFQKIAVLKIALPPESKM